MDNVKIIYEELKIYVKNIILSIKQIIKILSSKDFWKYVASLEWIAHFLNLK